MNSLIIRKAKNSDIEQVIELCAEHAEYENADYDKKGKVSKLKKALFKENPPLFCFVAEQNRKIVGYSTVTKEFSTWDVEYFLHMDCLYISKSARGLGLGSMFLKTLKTFCFENTCTHIQWQTPSDNAKAISFYKNQGAISKNKKRFYLSHVQ